jgi:type II secretory ATPase GspE/PulE/Tfp pilus assembly ATPase PilB-like protein
MDLNWVVLLADAPIGRTYVDPLKLLAFAALFLGWVLYAQWADKDAVRVNTFRQIWNIATLSVGAVGLALLVLVPHFLGAIGAYIVLVGAYMIVYIVHRNGLVTVDDRVCTPTHVRRIMTEGFGKKTQKMLEVKERVKIVGADRKALTAPEDPIERQQYAILQEVLYDALYRRASFMELLPAGQASRIRWTVDGVVTEREPMPRPEGDALLQYLKRLAGLNLEERRRPQKGKMAAAIADTKFELMVRTTGSTAGESMNIRVLGPEKSFKAADLGFTKAQLETMKELMGAEKGIILLTAPPGQGLTTSIYSLARTHDAFLQNIQMMEWEHEYDVDNITQKQYVPSDENPFSQDLIKIFRADPNVVLVPEVRDKATAQVCCDAAIKKQLVYVGLPGADLFEGLQKWMALIADPAAVSKSLTGVLHQRLVRKLCTLCKAAYKPDPATLQKINMPADKILFRPPEATYDKHGNPVLCQGCQGTGYVGRTAVFAILSIDDELRTVIRSAKSTADIKAAAQKKGAVGLQQHALEKVFDGTTSIDEVARATRAAAPAGTAKPAAAPAAPRPTTKDVA